ncbi:MAG: phosphatase PAP2 family protein [Alphaproteobacteria bacterium]|nr:phosphatase PAP2 family protein [Alphaproteobacteria bacterium]
MNHISRLLLSQNIDNLTYATAYIELPIPDIIRSINWKNILIKPPLNSSKVTIRELENIGKLTSNRTEKDIKLIYSIDTDTDSFFISLLAKYNLQYPQKHINEFYNIILPVLKNIKSFWNRPRPYQLAKYYNIPINMIITDTIDTPSYPSGHTVYSKLVANILHDMFPQISFVELDNIVKITGFARVIQGVHFPSDNEASIIFADYLFKILNPKLRNY